MEIKFKFSKLTAAFCALLVDLARSDWTDDFTYCNLKRLIDMDCDKETANGERFTMIPATQRYNNAKGYAMDITPWSTDTQLWIKMEVYAPLLPVQTVFEMYTSVLDQWELEETIWDTVKCSTEYWGNSVNNTPHNDFKVQDYTSNILFYEDTTVGNNESSVAAFLDEAYEGTSDWYLSTFADENTMVCNDYYCKVTCTVYRDQLNTDKVNDV